MKKLLLASATLFLFSASILMFQLSCSKDANAGNSGGSGTHGQGKILILKTTQTPSQFSIIDKNGTETIITPNLPAPYNRISDKNYATDGNIIFFEAFDGNTGDNSSLFSCDMNGGNVKNLNKSLKGYSGDLMFVF